MSKLALIRPEPSVKREFVVSMRHSLKYIAKKLRASQPLNWLLTSCVRGDQYTQYLDEST